MSQVTSKQNEENYVQTPARRAILEIYDQFSYIVTRRFSEPKKDPSTKKELI
jgi:hypothetical protein